MKINEDFLLRQVAGEALLIPVGQTALEVNGLVALSESGFLLYRRLQEGASAEALVQALTAEYEVSDRMARTDVAAFLEDMRRIGIVLEDTNEEG